jgi:hypothetical protein
MSPERYDGSSPREHYNEASRLLESVKDDGELDDVNELVLAKAGVHAQLAIAGALVALTKAVNPRPANTTNGVVTTSTVPSS